MELVLAIVGSFGTLALSINAFFLKGIYTDLNDVKIKMAQIFENAKNKDKRISALEDDIKELRIIIRELETHRG